MTKRDKDPFWLLVVVGFVALGAFVAATEITNTDGWINVTKTGNDSYVLNFNTTRPDTCAAGQASSWDGTNWRCVTTGLNGGNGTGYSIHACGGGTCDTGYYSTAY